MTLSEAITAVESSSVDLANADTAQAAATAKFEAAKTAKESADADDAAKVSAFNASLDQLITGQLHTLGEAYDWNLFDATAAKR